MTVNGWLLLDKPLGMTSTRLGTKVKRLLNIKKIGHCGTLDPMASGVLPLALGQATKVIPYVMTGKKAYRFTLRFGQQRDSGDAEGEIMAISSSRPSETQLREAVASCIGEITQKPSLYSAIKINGVRAYSLARQGAEVEVKSRRVHIYVCQLLHFAENEADIYAEVGAGTYIRSLAEDIARKVGTIGYVRRLRRVQVGVFLEKNTISLANLEKIVDNNELGSAIGAIDSVLDDIPVALITTDDRVKVQHGQSITSPIGDNLSKVRIKCEEHLVGLGRVCDGILFPERIFK